MFFYTFLPALLNMSLTASVAIVFVFLLRLLLRRAPKVIPYALWSIVLFRLLCPISIESGLSLFGLLDTPVSTSGALTSSIEYIPNDIVHMEYPSVVLPAPGIGEVISETLPQGEEQLVADPMEAPVAIATYIWMAGVVGMGIYAVASYLRLRRKLITASLVRENIYLADGITSPFVLGLVHPKIYLPSALGEREQPYIVMHEQHHIRRLDHIVKVLAFIALSIHWFNPLVWIAFQMASKDMEMSCDEAVVRKMGDGILADYTASLLSLATGRHIIAGMPLAFGEGDTKGRIRNLVNWKRPAIWAVLAAALVCVVLAVCLLTNPEGPRSFPMTGRNIADLDPQKIVDEISDLENLDNSSSSLYMNEAIAHRLYLTGDFEWFDHETMPFYYTKNQKTYIAQFVALGGNYSVTESSEGAEQAAAFLFQHYLEALKYLPQEQIKELAPDADQFNIAFLASGTPSSDYEHVITYTNAGIGNADGWLIHLKVQPMYKTGDDSYIGRPGDVIHVFYGEGPTVQEWFDYTDNPSDAYEYAPLYANLPEFPTATFRYAGNIGVSDGDASGPRVLISGMPIWNAYFCDLTGDNLPEICATLSIGSGMIDNRIIIYDYANGVSYELEDRGNHDYTLSLQDGKLLVTKRVYNSSTVVETGYLAYLNDTIQIVPLTVASTESVPSTTYVSYQCIYMNPLSSYAAIGGDSGFTYTVGDGYFETVQRNSGAKTLIELQSLEWQPFPYTDEEWTALFVPGISAMPNISELYDEILYLPLAADKFLMRVDGDIWIVELSSNEQMGTFLWSIYSLIPEHAMGAAQWEYAPALSSRTPVFQFQFDMEYTEISASCGAGELVEFNFGDGASDSSLTFPAEEPVSWSPMDAEHTTAEAAVIHFTVHDGDSTPYHGTLYIQSIGSSDGRNTVYTASLVGTGLHLTQAPEFSGGIISIVN